MEGSSQGRQELLLEHTRNLVQNSYEELGDSQILSSIYDYTLLMKQLEADKSKLTSDDIIKLQRLHKLFYNTDFDVNDPHKTGTTSTLILDLFKRNYSKIEKLIEETDNTRADILKTFIPLLKVNYYSDKSRKDIINRYLNEIIIPLIKSNTRTAIKTEKPEEEGAKATGETAGVSSSSFLSAINQVREQKYEQLAQSKRREGEETVGASEGRQPASSNGQKTDDSSKKADLEKARLDAQKEADERKAKASRDEIKTPEINGRLGIGSTAPSKIIQDLVRRGLEQPGQLKEFEKALTEQATQIPVTNNEGIFDNFFSLLDFLAEISSKINWFSVIVSDESEYSFLEKGGVSSVEQLK